jgi:hypothetical protein
MRIEEVPINHLTNTIWLNLKLLQSQNLKTDFFKFPRECLGVEADSYLEMILSQ